MLKVDQSPKENATGVDSFEAVALLHMQDLHRTASAMLRDHSQAEDIVQETYLLAWRAFSSFTPGTNCRAWLFKILFRVISHNRRKWFNRFQFSEPETLETTLIYQAPIADDLTDADILSALRKLPVRFAEVVLLADVQEFAYKEIGETLNIPIGTVMSRLSRGRSLLRSYLAPTEQPVRSRQRHKHSGIATGFCPEFGTAGAGDPSGLCEGKASGQSLCISNAPG